MDSTILVNKSNHIPAGYLDPTFENSTSSRTPIRNTYYDVYLPIGENCNPAYYLRAFGLRTEAYPLDWMVFGTHTMIRLFQTGFRDYFSSIVEEKSPEASPYRRIKDTENCIVSQHHFPKDREVADVLDEFRSMMRRRYLRLHDRLMGSGSLLMLCYSQDTEKQVASTLLQFTEIYPHLSIHLANVSDASEMASTELRREQRELNDRLTMTLYYFNNGYDTGNRKEFGLWGNEVMWQRTMKELCP